MAPQTAFSTSLISVVVLLSEMLKNVASPDSNFPPFPVPELPDLIGIVAADAEGAREVAPPESRC